MRLEVDGISFAYNSHDVLSDISFQMCGGQMVGIIGPNGSGKTTLLKCINRVLKPRLGTVLLEGKDLKELSRKEIALEIGVVPQNNEIRFPFTVMDVVMMGRSPALQTFQRESKEDLEIVEKAMRMTDVLRLADREIDQVSGGERQRVIIARALAQRPKVLLLDEPTLHLDVNHQLEVLDLVQDLAKSEGLTVIMVSHDLDLAARYCDRVIMLSEGSIRAAGKVEKVLTSENLEAVFKIRAYVKYDEEIGAHRVNIISVSNNGKEH
ncbi:MAG TPA: heme ABC transporter ATP-binding protein [Methanomassiliicoccales archaeon]|nr:heme ABC transporter ATP-binding protein [Methanomassiliicoccales archaeon]